MGPSEQDLGDLVAELNRTIRSDSRPDATSSLDGLLREAARQKASDLLIVAGSPAILRIRGRLTPLGRSVLDAEDTCGLLLPLLDGRLGQELKRVQTVDFCFTREGLGRFRANIHHQRGTLAASLRLLPDSIPTPESLNLPPVLRRFAASRQGLVLITGATGSGKSSTLAALIGLINAERRDHVVTIEDPIEFVHENAGCIIEQIEVGRDTPDFATSLRSLMRQTPDVILVGEMRDAETISTVLSAAETGHLVLSTLHTNDTSQAVSRILDAFPAGNQPQIRQQLSLALLAVVAQQLVPTADGRGRWPAVEVLAASPAIRSLIRKGDDHQIYSAVSTGRAEGMITMEQSLAELVRIGQITRETALAHCYRPEDLKRYLA